MKKRGFGQQIGRDSAHVPPLWNKVRQAEKAYISCGSGFLSALWLLRTYREAADSTDSGLDEPMRAYVLNNCAWFLATTDHLLLRNPMEAIDKAEKAVELTRRQEPMYLDTLAEALFRAGRVHEALEVERRALKLMPDAPYLKPQIEKFKKALGQSGGQSPSYRPDDNQ
ncbi:MAG: hypothetical protein GXP54_00575 [Deltaproteobacteria bacterium]|nr:hypothetical protein [Deltaproteobacteria bacterium]